MRVRRGGPAAGLDRETGPSRNKRCWVGLTTRWRDARCTCPLQPPLPRPLASSGSPYLPPSRSWSHFLGLQRGSKPGGGTRGPPWRGVSSINLSINLSIYLSTYINQSIYLSIYLSIYIYLSIKTLWRDARASLTRWRAGSTDPAYLSGKTWHFSTKGFQ